MNLSVRFDALHSVATESAISASHIFYNCYARICCTVLPSR